MKSTERTPPHVETKEDALRWVICQRNFATEEEIAAFFEECVLLGVGKNAFVFFLPGREKELVVRIETMSVMSQEWSMAFTERLREKHPEFKEKIDTLITHTVNRSRYLSKDQKKLKKDAVTRIRNQIASHNSLFRRDPSATIPINAFYTFQGKPVATVMRYLEGEILQDFDQKAQLTPAELLFVGGAENVMVNIKNISPIIQRVMIDVFRFLPSSSLLVEGGSDGQTS